MAKWDPDIVLDEALVRRLITGQCFEPHTLGHVGTGWDNEVWLADERWALRFPRRAAAVEGVELALVALEQLAPQLPLPIPVPAFVGLPADGFPWPFYGAELLEGRELGDLGEEARGALALPLAEFLRALHAATLTAALPEERIGDVRHRPGGAPARGRRDADVARRCPRPMSRTATCTSATC